MITVLEPRKSNPESLEGYLKQNFSRGVLDHSIRAHVDEEGTVTFYIHAAGVDSNTLDFTLAKKPPGPDGQMFLFAV